MRRRWIPVFCAVLLAFPLSLSGTETAPEGNLAAGGKAVSTLKVENDGSAHNLFDELGLYTDWNISPHTRFFARLEAGELMGYNAGWTAGSDGFVSFDNGFNRTEVFLESDVLRQAGGDPGTTLNLKLGYGYHQEILITEFTRFRMERSATSGINGFNFAVSLRPGDRFAFTAAINPASFGDEDGSAYPDVFGAMNMYNDHRGSSWGKNIHFIDSSMQLFYDSSSSLENNRVYNDLNPGDSMTMGIGGTLSLVFAGIEIFGFGMTEFFLMYDRDETDIMQAEWCAGFSIPLLSGLQVNLSGHNAIMFSGEGDNLNIGMDVQLLLTRNFGLVAAAAATGVLADAGTSLEGGLCLVFDHFEIFTGYSHHAIGGDPKYAKGAFDKVEVQDGEIPGGGFFLTLEASF